MILFSKNHPLCGYLLFVCFQMVASIGLPGTEASAQQQNRKGDQLGEMIQQGISYLRTQGQAEDGSFSIQAGPGLTALAVTSAMRNGLPIDDPMVSKGLAALQKFVKPDGGIYGNSRLRNYETCVSMICFAAANQTGQYTEVLQNAKDYVTGIQYGVSSDIDESDPWFGGVSYSGEGRPDLSNTAYFVEALQSLETNSSDPAIQNALAFISRCQNFDSPANDTSFSKLVNDGGFYYEIPLTKIDPSTSPEQFTENGGLRSYGSMSYAGFKSMIFAGLTKDDPRVKAAIDWFESNYSLDHHPGRGTAGLYYYYHTFGASLGAANMDAITDGEGNEHDWRQDLITALKERQNSDGSWSNENARWFENDKNLATSFALMALSYCRPIKLAASNPTLGSASTTADQG